MRKILCVGKSGRIDCIVEALVRSRHSKRVFSISEFNNPGLLEKSEELKVGRTEDVESVKEYARKVDPDFAVIGPEEPLAAGVVDALQSLGVPCVGPTQSLARLESSKSFTRELLTKYGIPGSPEYKIFRSFDGVEDYLKRVGSFVIKPDGLTGGKGVKVYGEHLHSIKEALRYCEHLFDIRHPAVVIEEKLDGEEFSLQSFCDGQHVVDTVLVQDHKRALDGDRGLNTGGMGSYSCENHSLPFLSSKHFQEASEINAAVARALRQELGEEYKGILFGGFILTKQGLRLLEYNARFGDPEVMNVLPLLKTDFIDVCEAIINGTLNESLVVFEQKATVCKYVVPEGYPTKPQREVRISLDDIPPTSERLRIYYAAVNQQDDGLYLTGSRAVAFVGIGNDLAEAEEIAENAARRVKGPVRHRWDIGTSSLVQKRIDHMSKIMQGNTRSSSR